MASCPQNVVSISESIVRKALSKRTTFLEGKEANPVYLEILFVLDDRKAIEKYINSLIYSESGYTRSRFNELTVLDNFLSGNPLSNVMPRIEVNQRMAYNYIDSFVQEMQREYEAGTQPSGRDQNLQTYCMDSHGRSFHAHSTTSKVGGNPCAGCNGTLVRLDDGRLLIDRQFG